MIGLFLGAGFSKWVANLPLVNQLFDFEISEIRYKDKVWIEKLVSAKRSWDNANENGNNEDFIQYIIHQKDVKLNKYLSKYLARRLSEPFLCRTYGGIQTFMYNDSKINSLESITKARKFLNSLKGEISGIITVNYDLIIEYALGTKHFNYGQKNATVLGRGNNPAFPWQNIPVKLTGDIVLSKIHGSISFDGKDYWSSGICGLNGKAVIVPPSPEKGMHKMIKKEWKDASKTLNSIDNLIVFGFNFNTYDKAVLRLLKKNTANIKRIDIYDIESKMTKARLIWPQAIITEHILET